MNRLQALVVLAALATASFEPILVKLGYRATLTPIQVLMVRNFWGALLILPVVFTARRMTGTTGSFRLSWAQARSCLGVSLLLSLTSACNLVAVSRLPATTVITLVTTTPALVALLNQRLGRHTLPASFWGGLGAAFVGILLSVGIGSGQHVVYDSLGFAACALAVLSSTLYRTLMEPLTAKIPPLLVSTYLFLTIGILSLGLLPWLGTLTPQLAMLCAWMGIIAAIANVSFLYAIHLVGSTNMSVFNLLQRPLLIALAAVILHEPMGPLQIVGVALVLVGVRKAQVKPPST